MTDGHDGSDAPLAIRPLGWVALAISAGSLYFLLTEPAFGTHIGYAKEIIEAVAGLSVGGGLLLHGRRPGTFLLMAAVSLGAMALILLFVEQLRR